LSGRREAILARFRAGSLERIHAMKLALAELAERPDRAKMQGVLGELHTLKGESRMLGLRAMSDAAHALEDLLAPAAFVDAALEPLLGRRSREALLVFEQALRGELGDDASSEEALIAFRASLASVDAGEEPATPAHEAADAPQPSKRQAAPPVDPAAIAERWAPVNVAHVDDLCDRMYEFAADFGRLHTRARDPTLHDAVAARALRAMLDDFDRCRARLDELTLAAWSLRLAPVERTLGRLLEHAEELAALQGKRVDVRLDSSGAQVERAVLDELWDLLIHLVRNAVDHGLEGPEERGGKPAEGRLSLSAEPAGGVVQLTIEDDGRGIDVEAVRASAIALGMISQGEAALMPEDAALDLVFRHGLSTREGATNVSGRGVGLAFVRRKVESLGGTITVASRPGRFTRFVLAIPASISRERVLVVEVGGTLYGLPCRAVIAVVRVHDEAIRSAMGGDVLSYRGEDMPLCALATTLGVEATAPEPMAAVLEIEGASVAFRIPRVLGDHDLVRRAVDPVLSSSGLIAASAILDDGRLVLLLRPKALAAHAARSTATRAPKPSTRKRALVVDDSSIVREIIREILAEAGLDIELAHSGAAALEALEARSPDIVLSDVEMPHMSGLELLREIRRRTQRLPVVMISTRGSVEDRRVAAEIGADAYLVKSDFSRDRLLEIVRGFVGETP
jgi:chemotaxis protein histidine kinase CheA/CheY-like chemotaxis protein